MKPTDTLNSNFIGITTLHVSGSLSAHHQEFLAVYWFWYISCRLDGRLLPGAGWNCSSILLLVAKGHHVLHEMYQSRCTVKNSWWWAERLPETCRVVIPMKLEFSTSVGFIHNELSSLCLYRSVRMEQLGSHKTDFHEIWCWSIFGRFVEKIQVSFKYEKYNGYFT